MKAKDLRSMSESDLKSKLIELRKEMIKHNAQIATGTTPKSPGRVKEIKKTIAKILTIVGSQTTKESDATHTQKEEPGSQTKRSKSDATQETTKPSEKKKEEEKEKVPAKKSEEE